MGIKEAHFTQQVREGVLEIIYILKETTRACFLNSFYVKVNQEGGGNSNFFNITKK